MGWFKKKLDPIAAREQELEKKLAELRSQIKQLDAEARGVPRPRVRSTARPNAPPPPPRPAVESPPPPPPADPVFERVELDHGKRKEPVVTREHFNEQGLRKYDLLAAWQRVAGFFRKTETPSSNPKLIKFLAAGRVDGLKTLRVEKRVARRRFIAFFVILLLLLLGIFSAFMRNR